LTKPALCAAPQQKGIRVDGQRHIVAFQFTLRGGHRQLSADHDLVDSSSLSRLRRVNIPDGAASARDTLDNRRWPKRLFD